MEKVGKENSYTPDDKRNAFQTWIKTDCVRATSRITGIPFSTLNLWKNKYNWEKEKTNSMDLVKKSMENNVQALNNLILGEMGKTSFEILQAIGLEGIKDASLSMLDSTKIKMDQAMITEIVKRKALQGIKKYKAKNLKEAVQLMEFVFKMEDKLLSSSNTENKQTNNVDTNIEKENIITIEEIMKKRQADKKE